MSLTGATSSLRGRPIYFDGELWRYEDTNEPSCVTWSNRSCGRCEQPTTVEGHDYCLGVIPDVMNACCGHGNDLEAYIQFADGRTIIRGADAVAFMRKHKSSNRATP